MFLARTRTFLCPNCKDKISEKKYSFFISNGRSVCLECEVAPYEIKEENTLQVNAEDVNISFINPNFGKIFTNVNMSQDEKIDEILFTFLNLTKIVCFLPLVEFLDRKENSLLIFNQLSNLQRPSFGTYHSLISSLEKEKENLNFSFLSKTLLKIFTSINNLKEYDPSVLKLIDSISKDEIRNFSKPLLYIIEFRNLRAHAKVDEQSKDLFIVLSGIVISLFLRKFKDLENEIIDYTTGISEKNCFIRHEKMSKNFFFYEKVKDERNVIFIDSNGQLRINLVNYSELRSSLDSKKVLYLFAESKEINLTFIKARIYKLIEDHEKYIRTLFESKTYINRYEIEMETNSFLSSDKKILIFSAQPKQGITSTLIKICIDILDKGLPAIFLEFRPEFLEDSLEEIFLRILNVQVSEWSRLNLKQALEEQNVYLILDNWNSYFSDSAILKILTFLDSFDGKNVFKCIFSIDNVTEKQLISDRISLVQKDLYYDFSNFTPFIKFPMMNAQQMSELIKNESKIRKVSLPKNFKKSNTLNISFLRNPGDIETFFFLVNRLINENAWDKPFQSYTKKVVTLQFGNEEANYSEKKFIHFYANKVLLDFSFKIKIIDIPEEYENVLMFYLDKKILIKDSESIVTPNYFEFESALVELALEESSGNSFGKLTAVSEFKRIISNKALKAGFFSRINGNVTSLNHFLQSELFQDLNINLIIEFLDSIHFAFIFESQLKEILINKFKVQQILDIFIEILERKKFREEKIIFKNYKFYNLINKSEIDSDLLDKYLTLKTLAFELSIKSTLAIKYLKKVSNTKYLNSINLFNRLKIVFFQSKFEKEAFQLKSLVREMQVGIARLRRSNNPNLGIIFSKILEFLAIYYENEGNWRYSMRYLKIGKKYLQNFFPYRIKEIVSLENEIARIYLKNGNFNKAEDMYKKVLFFRKNEWGENNPLVSACYTNLAIIERIKGNYKSAEQLVNKDLDASIKYFGENHKEVAKSYVNLGMFKALLNERKESLIYTSKGIEILEKISSREDILLPRFYSLMGNSLILDNNYSEAKKYLKKAFFHPATRRKDVLISILNNTGSLNGKEGNWIRARTLYSRAFIVAKHFLPSDHLENANILNNMSTAEMELGNLSSAYSLIINCLSIKKKVLPPSHLSLISSSLNHIEILKKLKMDIEAKTELKIQQQKVIEFGIEDRELLQEIERLSLLLE